MDEDLVAALTDNNQEAKMLSWPLLAAWILASIAIAGPSWKPEPNPFVSDDPPLIILLKSDISMDTPDPEPSRMERAHMKIADLAEYKKGQPIGLISYAGSAHLVMPPTKDTSAVAEMASYISHEVMPIDGDRLDLAISKASKILNEQGGSLVVITDTSSGFSDAIKKAHKAAGSPSTQILAIVNPSSNVRPLQPLADALKADLIPMSVDDTDIRRVADNSNGITRSQSTDDDVTWQDGGYYLVPFVALMTLIPFRRKSLPRTSP